MVFLFLLDRQLRAEQLSKGAAKTRLEGRNRRQRLDQRTKQVHKYKQVAASRQAAAEVAEVEALVWCKDRGVDSHPPQLPQGRNCGELRLFEDQKAQIDAAKRSLEDRITAAQGRRPQLGVCIVGQLSRLELESKLWRLVAPNTVAFDVHLAFVLAPEGHREYVNLQSDTGASFNWNVTTLEKRIREFAGNDLPRNSFENATVTFSLDLRPQEKEPWLWPDYLARLADYYHTSTDKQRSRAASHVRQWKSLVRAANRTLLIFSWGPSLTPRLVSLGKLVALPRGLCRSSIVL